MKALLVSPSYPSTFWSYKHALKFVGKKAASPPMGLLTVAALLPADWEKKLIDLNVTTLSDQDLGWADLVMVGAIAIQRESARQVIARAQAMDRKVVAGGPLFSSEPEEFPEVDYLVLDEAELTLPPFLRDLARGEPQRCYRSEEWADLNLTPVPAWELIDFRHYANLCIQVSRGCPFDCDFCDVTVLFGRTPRTKSAAALIRELDAIHDHGWRSGVFFVDDNFIGNRRIIKSEVLPAMIDWMKRKHHPFKFCTQASLDLAGDDRLIELMVEAGFDNVFIGIETPNEGSLRECGKLQNVRQDMLGSVRKLQSRGLQVYGGFILGFDNDKEDIFDRMRNFISDSGIVACMVGLLKAPPRTRLYARLSGENRITSEFSGNNTDYSTNFQPRMNHELLVQGYKRLIHEIYSPEHYYRRLRTFLLNYRRAPFKIGNRLQVVHLRALLISVFRIGLRPVLMLHFWKLMLWTLLRRPLMIPQALTLSIYGYHFMKHFEVIDS